MKTYQDWQLSFSNQVGADHPVAEKAEELTELLHDTDPHKAQGGYRPWATYLSGGLDSTYITSVVKRSFNNKLRTFSVAFTDDRFDETSFQHKAVQALNTDHSSIRCTDKDIGEVFPKVVWHCEAPLLRTAPAPLYRLSKLVRDNNFKVVLTGEGSDEIFAGYDIFKEDKVRRFWARHPNSSMRPMLLQKLYPDIFSATDKRSRTFLENFFRKGLKEVDSPAYSHSIRWENTGHLHSFFSTHMQDAIAGRQPFVQRFAETLPANFMDWDPLSRAQYTEISIFLSNYLLSSQGDRMAMANAIEGRYPFLDYRVVEFACKLHPHHRLHVLKDKYILRKSAMGLIPPEIAQRPKQPYRAPISRSFLGNDCNSDYIEDLLSESSVRKSGYFDPIKVTRLIQKCQKQNGLLSSERENMALVGIISTELLHNMFVCQFPFYPQDDLKNVKVYRQ